MVWLTSGCGQASPTANTKAGYAAVEALDYQSAEERFNQALAEGEDPVQAARGLGIALMGQARYPEAVDAFQQALANVDDKMEETVKDILLYKASAQYRMKDYEGTVASCDQLEQIDENLRDLYFFRGAAYLCSGDNDKARVNFDRAVSLDKGNYELYLNIYSVYDEMNLTGVGDEYLQTALSITPETLDDHYHIGHPSRILCRRSGGQAFPRPEREA